MISHKEDSTFKSFTFHKGCFELRSKDAKIAGPLITTEKRPEVKDLFRFLRKKGIGIDSHIEVESWTVASQLGRIDGRNLSGA